MTALLEASSITKRYGGLTALDGCTVSFAKGAVTGLIGPNGAGKTTLLSVIAGFTTPDAGTIRLDGADITAMSAHRRAARGLVRTFQIARELGQLTVFENLMVAGADRRDEFDHAGAVPATRGWGRGASHGAQGVWLAQTRWPAAARRRAGVRVVRRAEEAARACPRADARATFHPARRARGWCGAAARRRVGRLVRNLVAEGISFGIVEHDMDLIARLCDRVYVLAEGRNLVSGSFAEVAANGDVVEAYLGRAA